MGKRNAVVVDVPVDARAESPLPSLIARLFSESSLGARRRIVALLVGVAGPLALAALADGRFARFLLRSSSDAVRIPLEEARRLTEGQVLALARHAWQARPEVFERLAEALKSEDPMLLRTLTGALFVLAMSMQARVKRRTRHPGN
jgi:hypothetical protein